MHVVIYLSLGFGAASIVAIMYAFSRWETAGRLNSQADEIQSRIDETPVDRIVAKIQETLDQVDDSLTRGRSVFRAVTEKNDSLERALEGIAHGLTPPAFAIDDDEDLKRDIRSQMDAQYSLIANGGATVARTRWSWNGSESKGARMVGEYSHLLTRAFNAGFVSIRRQMRYNTLGGALGKLEKLCESLHKLAATVNVEISDRYFNLKATELRVWNDALQKRELDRLARKEQQEILRAERAAAKSSAPDDDEELDDRLDATDRELAKARALAASISGEEYARLLIKIERIEAEKVELEAARERQMSQAQITKAGYIYVISNVGSFGEGVVKIGMTRRLEPMDRVVELGDASVPFRFDIHTLAFVKNAPAVERALHAAFTDRRVNTDNHRKEFFRVTPQEVEAKLDEMGVDAAWYYECEAREYRESQLIMEAEANASSRKVNSLSTEFPETI